MDIVYDNYGYESTIFPFKKLCSRCYNYRNEII